MKKAILLLLSLIYIQCNDVPNKKQEQSDVPIPETLLGKDLEGNSILIGQITLEQLKTFTASWFITEYDRYKVQPQKVEEIKKQLTGKQVILVMGTWCEDSQREVPGMIKILTEAGYSTSEMDIFAIDEPKEKPVDIIEKYNITYIPALIFLEENKELNRIVEFPINTLETDILSILNGEAYKNAYAE